MAINAQDAGGIQWDDPSLTDASKLHAKIKGRYSGPNVNNSTYILKDAPLHWEKDDYAYLFKDRLTKEFKCEQNNSKLTGFGPWCSFQDIGRGQEHQCIFEERRKCITKFVDSLQAFPPRSPWNAVNTVSENRKNSAQNPLRIPLDSVAATQAREEWQRTGEPPLSGSFCLPPLVNVELTLCEKGKSGLVSIKAIQKALAKCLGEVNKKCQCSNCDEIPDPEDINIFKDDPTDDNPSDDPTDDDGDPAPSMQRQSTTVSSYEMPIPVTFGRVSVKGNIIWVGNTSTEEITYVEPLAPETDAEPSTLTKTVLTGAIAVGLCKGTLEGIAKITFGNRVVYRGGLPAAFDPYDVEIENTKAIYGELEGIVETAKRVTFELYQGSETQRMNPRMAAVNGSHVTPSYRDLAYLFIDNVPISEFARDGLPNITVEVYTRSVPGAMASTVSTPLDGSAFANIDPEFLAIDAMNDRIYVSGGNTGQITHGVRVFNSRNLVEIFQQAPTEMIPSSMVLTRMNAVMYQEKDFNKTRTHWYAPEYDIEYAAKGANSPGSGHDSFLGSLAHINRVNRGPAVLTLPGYSYRTNARPRWPIELFFIPSTFDDIARLQMLGDTHDVDEAGSVITGYPDEDPSSCYSVCITENAVSCNDYCTWLANNGGSTGDCVYDPPNITVIDGVVYDLELEEGIGVVDFIDESGNVFIVGSETPVAVQDCSGVFEPGDIPPDPLCISSCMLDAEAYCDAFCGSGTRIIEAIVEGRRAEIDPLNGAQTAQGAMIIYRPYATAEYSAMTALQIEWLHVASTEDDMAQDGTFLPEAYRTLPMSLWGNNASAILAQVITIPGAAEHVFFIKTTSGPDYAFRYNHADDEVIWERQLPARLPAVFSANDRKVEYPNTDYMYVGLDGSIVLLELAEGSAEIVGTTVASGLPAMTGAQLYDPRDQSITYINTTQLVKFFPTRPVIDDVGLDEIAAGVFALAGMTPDQYDVTPLADIRVEGYVIEDFGDAKTFLTQVRELFGLFATDNIPVRFGPPSTTPIGDITAANVLGKDGDEYAETRKWQDRAFSDVVIMSLDPGNYHTPRTIKSSLDSRDSAYAGERRFETKFSFFRGQAESLAEQFLATQQVTRGDLSFALGPEYAHLSPGDSFNFVGRDGVMRKYVIKSTMNASLPIEIDATTMESTPAIESALPPLAPHATKPLRKPVLLFTNPLNDIDAKNVIEGNQVVYAGIESPAVQFAARETFAFGRSRLTDTVTSGMTPTSAVRFPAIDKPLHIGTADRLSTVVRRNFGVCDRTLVLTVEFDRAASLDELSDATEVEVINDPMRNLLIYDGELIQFLTVTRTGPRTAQFRGIYRGRNGTEYMADIFREDQRVRVVYYTPDTVVSAVVTGPTYAGRPWVEAVLGDTRVGRNWHVPALYPGYDYGSRLWGPTHITATRLSPKPYAYPDVRIEWKPRSVLTERENTEFTPYLSSERYIVYIWSFFTPGTIPIEDFDYYVYRNKPGNTVAFQSPVIQGRRSLLIPEADWRAMFINANTSDLYIVVAQVNPLTGEVGLPGAATSARP